MVEWIESPIKNRLVTVMIQESKAKFCQESKAVLGPAVAWQNFALDSLLGLDYC